MVEEILRQSVGVGGGLAMLIALPGILYAQAGQSADPSGALLKELIAAMDRFDEGGRWKDTNSSVLGWSCGQPLRTLVYLYQATGERSWLDRLFMYAETMFANLTPNRDGFLSWRSRGYSPAYVKIEGGAANRSIAEVEPKEQWILDIEVRGQVKDDEFHLTAQKDGTLVEGEKKLPDVRYEVGKPFAGPFGIQLTLNAEPAEGDCFAVTTRQPKDFDFAVHEGMVLMPICHAVELVKQDEALRSVYGERADKLLRVIEGQLIPKWEGYWRETKEGGVYVFPDDPAFIPRNTTMPHNQYLPLGTVQILLHRITGKPAYKERATKMASFFKSRLRLVNDHYDWNYWDAAGAWDQRERTRPEDTGHGSLDIGFALTCAENGIVFTEVDMRRFANTFVRVMWNGSADRPTVGGWVNTDKPSRQSGNL